MSKLNETLSHLFQELRRRKTFQAAAAYIVFAWVLIEGASVILPAFAAPQWILPSVIVTLAVGLPVAVVLSWVFDLSFAGFERTQSLEEIEDLSDTAITEKVLATVKPSIAVPLGSARRRQVTVLRCTFEQLREGKAASDHEAMLALRETFDGLIGEIVTHFTGIQTESSGVTYELLFGYPTAFENDALRACAAAFSIRQRLRSMKVEQGGAVAVASIGIHSDAVVIEKAHVDDDAITVVGDVSPVAAWLQTLAVPGSITLSEQSHLLLRDKVRAESLGIQKNLRADLEMEIFSAAALMPHDTAEKARAARQRPIIGRDAELAMLLDRWAHAEDGEDQFVLLRGEPGMGKSTLVNGFIERTQSDARMQLMPLYCSPFETNSAFHPIIEYFLGADAGSASGEERATREKRLSRLLACAGLDAAAADLLHNELLTFASTDPAKVASGKTAEETRRELLSSLLEYFRAAARQGPVLIVVEDIHWADPSTLEIIDMMMSGASGLGIFSLFTARPDTNFDWTARPDVLVLDLQRLPRRAMENLIREAAGDDELPAEMLSKIINETDGNPLFAEELTRAIVEQGVDDSGALVLSGTVHQSLESRMDKLGDAQPLLQLCSLLGVRFDYELLLAVSETENEKALQSDLRKLVNFGLLYQEGAVPDSVYRFKHMLMQETAHGTLLKATRMKQHAQIAVIIESRFPSKAQRQPELLAYHYSEGGAPDKSTPYWIQACRKSLQAYAIREANEQAESGLRVVKQLPEGKQRDALEVTLLSMRGKAMIALRGYSDPDVEKTFARALKVCDRLGDSPQLFQLVVGLWMYFFIAGEVEHALALARRLFRIAEDAKAPAKLLQSHYCLGYSMFRMGLLREALDQFELAMAQENGSDDFSSESASGDDTRIHLRIVMAHLLWFLGDDDRSLAMAKEARTLADEVGNPFGMVFAKFMSSWLHMLRRDPVECAEHAGTTIALAMERGFHFWLPVGHFMQAWASCEGGTAGDDAELTARVESMESSLLQYVRTGANSGEVSLALQLAEERIRMGHAAEALTWIERAERSMAESGECFLGPDALRLRGRLAAISGDAAEAEESLVQAESAARSMQNASLARRAGLDIASLLKSDHAGVAMPKPGGSPRSAAPGKVSPE